MPILLFLLGLAVQDDPKALGKQALERAREMRQECAEALESVDGVGSVGLGGNGIDYRIVVAVRDAAAQRRVRDLIGDTYGGVRILWSIAEAPRRAPVPPEPPAALPRPMPSDLAADPMNAWTASPLDCDILRDHLKLKPLPHPAGNGKSWVPCQIMKRTMIGPGGVTSFTYTNHRPDCPIRLGQVGEPPGSDSFTAWVFRRGTTPPTGGDVLLPSNGWAWGMQAAADMASRLPSIRDGEPAAGPVWIDGYGWLRSDAPDPFPHYDPYRCDYGWRPHHWYFLRCCHPWRHCR
ncbi:MAG TPA: hypothetical protein VMU54_07980 [Planctomycetota bacterium]|nr:hypothetical protein [Planctomycetota bacterium]